MSVLLDRVLRDKERIVALRRELHRCAELALREYQTAAVIERELDALGIGHKRVGETGVLGTLCGAKAAGRAVALRADIDALPIREETESDYRSVTDGVMHACGHDAHTACLLGAAAVLAGMRDRFGGEVRFLFQPAEETGGGAAELIAAGALQGVDRVFGIHVAPDLPVGTVSIKPGPNNAAVDRFCISLHGRAAHVSTPHLGADALYAACQTVAALQGLVSRRSSPTEPIVIGAGRLNAGTTYNAVAEYAELEGTTRTVSQEVRMQVRRWIDETACHVAAVSGAAAEVIWTGVCSAVVNDAAACAEAQRAARAFDGGLTVIDDRPLSLGGDNFAEYLREVPGCYAYLGTADPRRPNTLAGIHNGHFDLAEDMLVTGTGLYAACALQWLGEVIA